MPRTADRAPPAVAPPVRVGAPALVLALLLTPSPAPAQATVSAELGVLGANALVGGATAGIAAWLRGDSFARAFGEGAMGGTVVYAGKRMASSDVPGGGLVGRMVAAAGSSVVRNSAVGHGAFDRFILPVGPVNLYWTTRRDSTELVPKLDLGRSIFLAILAFDPGVRIDWGESLSAGAPVFRAPDRVIEGEGGAAVGGVELLATITLSDVSLLPADDGLRVSRIVAHERVHVLQDDFLSVAWADPVEDWLLAQVPEAGFVRRHIDVGGVYLLMGLALMTSLSYDDRPWEVEAHYLGATR